jgi:hypothetical protein
MTTRTNFIALLITTCFILFSCKKDNGQFSAYQKVNVKNFSCQNLSIDNDVEICADSLIDQRCPIDMVCITSGYTIAFINFKVNNISHKLTLGGGTIQRIYPADTMINGYKIKFEELKPHRKASDGTKNPNSVATIVITK